MKLDQICQRRTKIKQKLSEVYLTTDDFEKVADYMREAYNYERRCQEVHKGLRKYLISQTLEKLYKAESVIKKYE